MDLEDWSTRLKVFADATRVRLLALLELEELTVAELSSISTPECPFGAGLPTNVRSAGRWVQPDLVVEAEFGEWTHDGVMRHPSYVGQRFDREANTVVLESPTAFPGTEP